ncbi:hypothetical protein RHMOL_Rhmol05G0263900 [Rhododendron molle]|uniref:Uncharacterized protein n=1 Tax=Rhododendron molle TaxID=49168 RepID=A0ACC0NUT2_RHOML|nr:hypothetical protein RHMOL_Rhmol05G0263900 [Rhododendron molle]
MNIIRQTPADFLPNPSVPDRVIWTLTSDGNFSAKSAWEACRHRNSFQPWHTLVWFSQGVPRWSFIAWLAILGRLSTKDRLVRWGMVVPPLCSLCLVDIESHSHLFFDCQISKMIWRQILARNGITRPVLPLAQELEWAVQSRQGKSLRDSLYKLFFGGNGT